MKSAIILAAGKGSRMKSELPKVLHRLNGKPMVQYVLEACQSANVENLVLVVGHKAKSVINEIGEHYTYALQEEQLGTGHAVMCTREFLENKEGTTLVLCGDTPLITSETISKLIEMHETNNSSATILTTVLDNPTGYGRIMRNEKGQVAKVVEEKDTNDIEKKVKEVNTGTCCFNNKMLFDYLSKINNHNAQGEYYITDVIELLVEKGEKVLACETNSDEAVGINTIETLKEVEEKLKLKNE